MKILGNFYRKTLLMGLLFFIFSCSKQDSVEPELDQSSSQETEASMKANLLVFKGPQVQLGDGKVRSWMSVDREGFPIELALEFTEGVYENLDILPFETSLPLHPKAKEITPFEHITLNWNPHGHLPAFLVPHFDFHFYMISNEERLLIPEYTEETASLFTNLPPLGYMPSNYGTPPGQGGVYPQMGKHWLPINLPAYLPFTQIMVLGSYNGKYIFTEPMVDLIYIQSQEDYDLDISQPQFYEETNNYPTKYNIYRDDTTGNTIVSLSGFVARN